MKKPIVITGDARDRGARLKAFREYLGMTQIQMAEYLGMGPRNYGYCEAGKTQLSYESLIRLIEKDLNVTWLLYGEPHKMCISAKEDCQSCEKLRADPRKPPQGKGDCDESDQKKIRPPRRFHHS